MSQLQVYMNLIETGNKRIIIEEFVRKQLYGPNAKYAVDQFNIDTLLINLRYEFVRKLNVSQFAELLRINMQGITFINDKKPAIVECKTIHFDDLVDLGILGILKLQ